MKIELGQWSIGILPKNIKNVTVTALVNWSIGIEKINKYVSWSIGPLVFYMKYITIYISVGI